MSPEPLPQPCPLLLSPLLGGPKRNVLAISLQLFDLFKHLSFVCGTCSNQKIDLGRSRWKRILNGKSQTRAKGVGRPWISLMTRCPGFARMVLI